MIFYRALTNAKSPCNVLIRLSIDKRNNDLSLATGQTETVCFCFLDSRKVSICCRTRNADLLGLRDGRLLDFGARVFPDLVYEIRDHGSTDPKVTGKNCRYALGKQFGRSTPWHDTVRTVPQYFHDTVALQIVGHN